jgi:ATP-dependent Clp protease ATP-binding subunit ClpC
MTNIKIFLKQSSIYNVLSTESLISEKSRNRIEKITSWIIIAVLICLIYPLFSKSSYIIKISDILYPRLLGIVFINISIFIFMRLLELYYSTMFYFEHIAQNKYKKQENYTFSAGRILYAGRNSDILHGFFLSEIGQSILKRLGIDKKEALNFIKNQEITKNEEVPTPRENILKVSDIINYLSFNKNFANFIKSKGISEKDLIGASEWVIYQIESEEYKKQWSRQEALKRKGNIGKGWSFGETYILDKYSRDILNDEEVSSEAISLSARDGETFQLENALLKSSSSNALIIGEPGEQKMHIIWSLARNIRDQNTSFLIEQKRPVLFLVGALLSVCKDKNTLENELTKCLSEAHDSGNVILVIDNLPELISMSLQYGVDIYNLLDTFLKSPEMHVIGLSDTNEYHEKIEPNRSFMSNFEIINALPLSTEEITKIISGACLEIENIFRIFFTYQAIREIAESAEYYFSGGVSYDRSINILKEIIPWAKGSGYKIIGKDEVLEYIEQKTNIPTGGKISEIEKEKLLNLESLLGQRVIGQFDAIAGISNSIRRARSGIRNERKPIGSFLFLGPTGVGKTETAKALAEVFFESEKNMMRLDMSEYQTDDSLEKLIGSFKTDKPGIFTSMLRDKPFGVVLLDEFEKTHKDVLNLFLQILDEGVFSDSEGEKISTRNIIFIATSNAGADKIYDMQAKGKNPKDAQEEIIADIISRGLLKPELINRFDGTIIFSPLSKEDLKKIAEIMLKRVNSRLLEKGITMKITQDIIDFVAVNGANKTFGARPMNRFIQDTIEKEIAELIIKKEVSAGNVLSFEVIENEIKPIVSK